MSDDRLARAFHEAYERLAPSFGYVTRPETAVAFDDLPAENKALMVAVTNEVVTAQIEAWRSRCEAAEAENAKLREKNDRQVVYGQAALHVAEEVERLSVRAGIADLMAEALNDLFHVVISEFDKHGAMENVEGYLPWTSERKRELRNALDGAAATGTSEQAETGPQ